MQSNKQIILNKENETISKVIDIDAYRIGYFIMKCPGANINEDSLFISNKDDSILFGVSDGAGGHPKGAEASNYASNLSVDYYQSKSNFNPSELFEKINKSVLDLKVGAHCTLTLALIHNHALSVHSVGDSELIYWNAIGNEVYSNIPHSEIGYKVESGVLDQAESLDDPNRYLVTNLIGDQAIRIETTTPMELKKGHTILVGSDGLFDNISHEELQKIVSKGLFEEAFQKLTALCEVQDEESWKKEDDISFILVRKIQ
jgi:serine/threonine protein phosphatase PrpC